MTAKAVDQTFRRKWNKAEFEALAATRAASGGVLPEERVTKPIIYEQDRGTSEARTKSLALDIMVGTHVQVEDIKKSGFYCEKCDRSEKDSAAWLDHLNSVQHQRLHGTSLAAERSTVEDVRERMKQLKRKKLEVVETVDIEEKLRLLRQSDEQRRAERKLKRKLAKKAKKGDVTVLNHVHSTSSNHNNNSNGGNGNDDSDDDDDNNNDDNDDNNDNADDTSKNSSISKATSTANEQPPTATTTKNGEDEDAAMAAMMGLPIGFGTTKK